MLWQTKLNSNWYDCNYAKKWVVKSWVCKRTIYSNKFYLYGTSHPQEPHYGNSKKKKKAFDYIYVYCAVWDFPQSSCVIISFLLGVFMFVCGNPSLTIGWMVWLQLRKIVSGLYIFIFFFFTIVRIFIHWIDKRFEHSKVAHCRKAIEHLSVKKTKYVYNQQL